MIMPQWESLPIAIYRSRIVETVARNPVTIIVGDPGCGKTTGVPPFLFSDLDLDGCIAITQPRRLAVRTVTAYVARQLGTAYGSCIGFRVRFEEDVPPGTRLLFLTEGILARDLQGIGAPRHYNVIVLDEVHERTLAMDLCLGLAKQRLRHDPDVRLLLMSATPDVEKLVQFFDVPPVIHIEGRSYPVTNRYAPRTEPTLTAQVVAALREVCASHPSETPEHDGILTFLPGEGEIADVRAVLEGAPIPQTLILPLHGSLSLEEQEQVYERQSTGWRKIVLATNIAEASVTVPGISIVVDTGLIRQPTYDPVRGIGGLPVVPHSRAGCDQRAGRAGRLRPGICCRLYSQEDFKRRPAFSEPEILQTSIAGVVLELRAIGVRSPAAFPFLDPPDSWAIFEADRTLRALGATDADDQLTLLGWEMRGLPLDPRLARVLFAAAEEHCLADALTICAALTVNRSVFWFPREHRAEAIAQHQAFFEGSSDCLTLLNVYRQWALAGQDGRWCRQHFVRGDLLQHIAQVRAQLADFLAVRGRSPIATAAPADPAALTRALLAGLGDQLWRRDHGRRYVRGGEWCILAPWSAAAASPPDWFVCADVFRTSIRRPRGVHPVPAPDILAAHKAASGPLTRRGSLQYDPETGTVVEKLFKRGPRGSVHTRIERTDGLPARDCILDAIVDGRLITPPLAENQRVLNELGRMRERMTEQLVPWITKEMLHVYYRDRLGYVTTKAQVEARELRFTAEDLRGWLGRDLEALRVLCTTEYPDTIPVLETELPVQYVQGQATATLTADTVRQLPFDILTLPGGQPVRVDVVICTPDGSIETRLTETSLEVLREQLRKRAAAQERAAAMQRRCDTLRARIQRAHTTCSLPSKADTKLRELLQAAESAAYAWDPNSDKAERALQHAERLLRDLTR